MSCAGVVAGGHDRFQRLRARAFSTTIDQQPTAGFRAISKQLPPPPRSAPCRHTVRSASIFHATLHTTFNGSQERNKITETRIMHTRGCRYLVCTVLKSIEVSLAGYHYKTIKQSNNLSKTLRPSATDPSPTFPAPEERERVGRNRTNREPARPTEKKRNHRN